MLNQANLAGAGLPASGPHIMDCFTDATSFFYPCVAGDVRRPQKALQTQSFRNPRTVKVI